METKKDQIEKLEKTESSPESYREIRSQARRKLMKAGLISVPVIMTVHSRPLFAQSIGSTEALSYGGYDGANSGEATSETPAEPNIYDPHTEDELFDDLTFTRKRDPRSR